MTHWIFTDTTPAPGTLLQSHPNLVPWGEAITAVVAVVSFIWAGKFLPRRNKDQPPQRRLDQVEAQVGTIRVCNPGRRSTDRCSHCPMNELCERYPRLQRTAEELERDEKLIEAMRTRQATMHVPGTVVVVEDQDAVRMVTEALLEQVGIKTRGARTLAEALPFQVDDDVLVSDWNLPDATGLDVVSAFHAARPGSPVILMSAMDVQPESVPAGAVWLTKPFDPDFFIALVRKMQAREEENA